MRVAILTAMNVERDAVVRAISGRDNVSVFRVGICAKHVPAAEQLRKFDTVVMAGLAGGLDPELKTGDVVVDETSDQQIQLPYRYCKIACCQQIVGSVREKMELFARTGALAVEMENDVVRKIARELDKPYLHVRTIADTAEDVLDPALVSCLDEFGRVKSIRLIKHLGALPGLARKSKIACAALTRVVGEVVEKL